MIGALFVNNFKIFWMNYSYVNERYLYASKNVLDQHWKVQDDIIVWTIQKETKCTFLLFLFGLFMKLIVYNLGSQIFLQPSSDSNRFSVFKHPPQMNRRHRPSFGSKVHIGLKASQCFWFSVATEGVLQKSNPMYTQLLHLN